ncbi:unnamed protein product [Mytilus coruscus]|uniref:Uncharacterized protein n=1 Tax=Mytilus coruscus TaxID=42192 RepID=A0A6J8ARS9_MYTCO|nr:unnamed protein product [Mytilus coruscus]
MRKYDLVTSAAPEQEACGLAIEIVHTVSNKFTESKDPVECTKGKNLHFLSLALNGVIILRSRSIGGNFSRDYNPGDNLGIQLNCSHLNMETTQQMTDAAIHDKTESDHKAFTTSRSETQRIKEGTSNNLKHVTSIAESNNVGYSVVDKSRTDEKVKHITALNDSNVEYAVIDKK